MFSHGKYLCETEDQNDDSFSSQSDDYESSNEYQKLEASQDLSSQENEIDKIINQSSELSHSLLHVLDGNEISPQSSFEKGRKRQLNESAVQNELNESAKKPLLDTENDSTDF